MNQQIKLNKDGTPRKKGSGRPKNSVSLTTVSLRDLNKYLPPDAPVAIGVKWARTIGILVDDALPKSVTINTVQPEEKAAEQEPTPKLSFTEIDLDSL